MKNLYDTLGVDSNADLSEIKTAYRKLSKKFHPDLNANDEYFEKMFIRIQEAYDVLSNAEKRTAYDDRLRGYRVNNFSQKLNTEPKIINFSSDKLGIKENEIFHITWDVVNADSIEIKPFGKMPKSGVEGFRFRKISTPYINIVLLAYNSKTNATVRNHITLDNLSYNPNRFYNVAYIYGNTHIVLRILLLLILLIIIISYSLS